MTMTRRLAAFGFRSIPQRPGCSGADKFAEELYVRLAARGYRVTGYNRVYDGSGPAESNYKGVTLLNIQTAKRKGVEALLHSAKVTFHIIWHNTSDVVHIQNGGNSIFIPILRLFGKKVFLTEDGAEWNRGKWPWYARLYLRTMMYLTAFMPNGVIFDNVFVREIFERRFGRSYYYVPYGSDPQKDEPLTDVLERLGLAVGEYFLFVGRFIPEKGLQYLVPAFEKVITNKRLVVVGGGNQGSDFAAKVTDTSDKRVLFPGFMYGPDVHTLMRGAYAYIQPSDLEGLSPVILENMGLGTPVICSDIRENIFVVGDTAVTFRKSDERDLTAKIQHALEDAPQLRSNAERAKRRAADMFSWEAVTTQHEMIFFGGAGQSTAEGDN
jgi:glycosyltransferase involved in cell wall biosynthesis